jgi:hypothetical protein
MSKRPPWADVRPAYANVFVVGVTPEAVRLTFGEGFGPEAETHVHHTAIIMGRTDARGLAEGILRALAIETKEGHG